MPQLAIIENNVLQHLNATIIAPKGLCIREIKGRRREKISLRLFVGCWSRRKCEYFPLNGGKYHDRRGASQTVSK